MFSLEHFKFYTWQYYHLQALGTVHEPLFSFWLYAVNPYASGSFPAANACDLCLGRFATSSLTGIGHRGDCACALVL